MIFNIPDPATNFLEFWIRRRIQPILFRHDWKYFMKKHLKINQKEESTNYLPLSISHYSTVLPTILQSRIFGPKTDWLMLIMVSDWST